jgi:Amt family ammonium transporter
MRFAPYIVGSLVICGVIYPVYGSWAWGGVFGGEGWLAALGFVDFAGATVVHSVGGWCALAAAIVVGPRMGRFGRNGSVREIPGHNLPVIALGVFILWFGWFGFNGGSAMVASPALGIILANTQLAGVAGALAALLAMILLRAKVHMTTALNGGLGGLVAITAGAATMSADSAILTGLFAGVVVVLAARLLQVLRVDDVVNAVPVHAFCGVWGTLAAGLFYAPEPFEVQRIIVQAIGAVTAFFWAFPVALLLFGALRVSADLRVSSINEQRGLDMSEHFESAYPEFQASLANRTAPNAKAAQAALGTSRVGAD